MKQRTESPPAVARLHIDWTRCDGRGICTELLPEVLKRDDWGYPLAAATTRGSRSNVPIPEDLLDMAQDAVTLCPRLALKLIDPAPTD